VFNNFFIAALEGEHAALEGFAEGNVDNSRSLYDHVTTGFSIALDELGDHRPISAETYASGEAALTHERYGATLDASCLAFHQGESTAPCHDTIHVLANHLNHEFFYVLAQRDQSLAEGGGVKAQHCDGNDVLPGGCLFAGVEIPWTALIRKQLADVLLLAGADRCEAGDGVGPYDRTAVWAPNSTSHAGWQDDAVATSVLSLPGTGPITLANAAFNWLSGGPRRVFVEDLIVVDGSARNAALGLPVATSP